MRASCHCGSSFSGKQEHCTICHGTFSCTRAGDKHRAGPFTKRRCLTATEMGDRGLHLDARGVWRLPQKPSF